MRFVVSGYALVLALAVGAAVLVLDRGADLAPSRGAVSAAARSSPAKPGHDPLGVFLLQIVVVAAVARLGGLVAKRLGQPAVVGEIAAGLALGPSLLGALSPDAYAALFPPASLGALKLISQLGVIVFMFLVGLELDLDSLGERTHAAVLVSHASIIIPMLGGMALALRLYGDWAPSGVGFVPFALFMGVAMSVTAFPVLARILTDRGLTRTPLGSLALTCAAVDDVTAWSLLAVVVAIAQAGSAGAAAYTILWAGGFTALMLYGVKPVLARVARAAPASDTGLQLGLMVLAFSSALATEAIGIHALFGAFVAGVITPHSPGLRGYLRERLGGFATLFLLPLFFALTGLRTRVGLIGGAEAWGACLAILGVAVAGKFLGSAAAARLVGLSWGESFSLGALMNTRGLMELVALNVGYELGVISEPLFAMMVLMALATTAMAGPALSVVEFFAPAALGASSGSGKRSFT